MSGGGDGISQDVRDALELRIGDHEWWSEQDRVAVDAVRVAGTGVQEHPPSPRVADDGLGESRASRERLSRFTICDELDPDHQPAAPDLADVALVRHGRLEKSAQPIAFRGTRCHEILVPKDPQHFPRDAGATGSM